MKPETMEYAIAIAYIVHNSMTEAVDHLMENHGGSRAEYEKQWKIINAFVDLTVV